MAATATATATLFSFNTNLHHHHHHHPSLFLGGCFRVISKPLLLFNQTTICILKSSPKFIVLAATEGSAKSGKPEEKIPSWASPDSEEPPPWARDEPNSSNSNSAAAEQTTDIPFYVYLLSSAIIAIAAIGSVFEYVNQNPVFGILNSDSIFYAPILGFFAFTGIPLSGFLWFKSVQVANKEAEEQDKKDGYL